MSFSAKAPVKVTVFTGLGSYSTIDQALADGKVSSNNYDRIAYSDGFVQQTWNDNYFLRMEALFVAPETGSFKFKVQSFFIARIKNLG